MPPLRRAILFLILSGGAALFPSGCAVFNQLPPPPSRADSALALRILQEVQAEYWREVLPQRYEVAIASGMAPTALPDVSPERRRRDLRLAQRLGRELDRLNPEALSQGDYLTALAMRWELDARAESSPFYWVDFADLSPATTPLRELAGVLAEHPLATTGDAEGYLYFVEGLAFVLERIQSGLEARRERGFVAPRELVQSAIDFLSRLRALGSAAPWVVDEARMAALDTADQRALRSEVAHRAATVIEPALDSMVRYLRDAYLPHALERPGLWQQPGGKEFYRHLLRRHGSLDVPPEEAHRVGLGELRRIDSTLAALRAAQGWNPSTRAFHDSLRLTTEALASLDDVVAAVLRAEARLAPALASQFSRLPAQPATVRAAGAAEALLWPDGAYRPPAGADTIGTLLLTDRWREGARRIGLASATYRLLVPGRHLEAALVRGTPDISPVRRFLRTPGFSDGWSEYAASLAGELGRYDDALDAYGRLLDAGSASALLVVDTGIHYLGWSMAQARAVLGRYVLADDAAVERMLVERVVNDPGRSGAGALGGREVAAMRAWMQREQGRDYSASAWHAEMLSLGSLPLPIVGSHLEWWLYDVARRRAMGAADPGTVPRGR